MGSRVFVFGVPNSRSRALILCELDGGLRRHGVLGEEVQVQREPGLLVMTRGKASVGNTESEWNAREGLPLPFIHSFVA